MKHKCILVIDSEDAACDSFRLILTREGYEVKTTLRSARGLKIARDLKPPPDLIIASADMPDMPEALDLLRHLKIILHEVPVIVVGADTPADTPEKAIALGALAYLEKPIEHEKYDTLLALVAGAFPPTVP